MLDRALRLVFRDLTTFFLIVFAAFLPLELAFSFAFQDVAGVRDLHETIRSLPAEDSIRGVGPDRLETSDRARQALIAMQVIVAVLLVIPIRRVMRMQAAGEVPSVWGAYLRRHPADRSPRTGANRGERLLACLGGAAFALAIGLIGAYLGNLVITLLPRELLWGVGALIVTAVKAAALPFLLVPLASFGQGGEGEAREAQNHKT